MNVYSFIRDGIGLRTVEIEISLVKGLPKLQFIGFPDSLIKESVARIQSAIKAQGFQLPRSKQILVHLTPNHLKKSSLGLDLAVAAAILWETKQIPKPSFSKIILYGELSLKGEVKVPDDIEDVLELPFESCFYSGQISENRFDYYSLNLLKDLAQPQWTQANPHTNCIQRPELLNLKISEEQSEVIKLVALGEHPVLFAGPPGTGKSTLAHIIYSHLDDPNIFDFRKFQQISRQFGMKLNWRPYVTPHHTATPLAMIGGGAHPVPGEITRAHGGVLLMDEFLEFDPRVQEALREPLETGHITVSRTGSVMVFPAGFLLIATTNLCPCGYLVPEPRFECRGRPKYCQNYVQKLSGPMLDRFTILNFSHSWVGIKEISTYDLHNQILEIRKFQMERTQLQPEMSQLNSVDHTQQQEIIIEKNKSPISLINNKQESQNLLKMLNSKSKRIFEKMIWTSERRKIASLRVARTIADTKFEFEISTDSLEQALRYTHDPFQKLKHCIWGFNDIFMK